MCSPWTLKPGAFLWDFDPQLDRGLRLNLFINRGVAYWSDGYRKRIFLGDLAGRLYSMDAVTGRLDPDFGQDGMVDLKQGILDGFEDRYFRLTSPVAVCGNVLVVGGMAGDGTPQGPPGDIRGFDAASGKQLWRFHTVPHPGEFGNHTWGRGLLEESRWSQRLVHSECGS